MISIVLRWYGFCCPNAVVKNGKCLGCDKYPIGY